MPCLYNLGWGRELILGRHAGTWKEGLFAEYELSSTTLHSLTQGVGSSLDFLLVNLGILEVNFSNRRGFELKFFRL